jgi:hypothetical protein
MMSLREQVIEQIQTMDEAHLQRVAKYIKTIADDRLAPDYDPEKDPLVGFVIGTRVYDPAKDPLLNNEFNFSGGTDFSTRVEDILEAEFGREE